MVIELSGPQHIQNKEFVAFRTAEQDFCVDIMMIREIRGWTRITSLPHAPAFVLGVINLRGSVVPIVDFSARLGLPALEHEARNVIIIAVINQRIVGLLVESVSDIIGVDPETIQATPDVASDTPEVLWLGLLPLAIAWCARSIWKTSFLTLTVECDWRMPERATNLAEFPFTNSDFRYIAEIAYQESGLSLPEAKSQLVYSRLVKRIREYGFSSFREYCDLVRSPSGNTERQVMVAALTTNVTRFRREAHHATHFRNRVLPELIKRAEKGQRIRLWSAACATGQEAYEIAFEVLNLCANATDLDVKVLATDIDPISLNFAQTGIYNQAAIKGLPAEFSEKYFRETEGRNEYREVSDGARKLVTFRVLNLIRPWLMRGPFDVVFCRNVAIYFDQKTQQGLWGRLAEVISPDGVLYIGHSERLSGYSEKSFVADGVTTFRRTLVGGACPSKITRPTRSNVKGPEDVSQE
jgi:chemotaxis protein methyltransferase CheR